MAMDFSRHLKLFKKDNLPVLLIMVILLALYQAHFFTKFLGITPSEEVALIILLVTAILWVFETIPLFVTSLMVLFLSIIWLLPIMQNAGLGTTKEQFLSAFFGDITMLFMGGFVLSILLNKYGLARRMANWMLQRTGEDASKVMFGIILISSFLSMWMSNTATAAMMFAIVGPIMAKLPDTSTFSKGLAIAIPFACNLGGMGTPIGTPPNAIAIEYLNQKGFDISFIEWMIIAIPLTLILLILLWRILLIIFPSKGIKIEVEKKEVQKLSPQQRFVLGLFLLTVFGWLTGGITGLSSGTVGLMVVIAAFGFGLLNQRDFRNISWDILFMLGGGLCLGVGLSQSGLTDTIAGALPIESGFFIAVMVLMVVAALMTTFMSNTATANLLIPVAISLPQNQLILTIVISIMCSSAMALPVSTPPNAVAFGSGMLKTKDMLYPGLLVTILSFLLTLVASFSYIPLFF
ncbi:MAG: SLC13/DASS family transporter [Bacteroidetes bacterium]|nr:MAG: SLC13/DASS family transporter [Bacteroidota bacterium]